MTLSCGEHTDSFGPAFLHKDASRLPHPRVEVIPGVGHFGPLEQPTVVADSVLESFGSEAGAPSTLP